MSRLIQFIERVRDILTPDEWRFFSARYIERKSVADAAALLPTFAGDAEAMHESVLRKLRSGRAAI